MSTPTATPDNLLLDRAEVCQLLGVSVVTLWRLEKLGRLRSVPGIRRKIYPHAEIERFLKLPKPGGAV